MSGLSCPITNSTMASKLKDTIITQLIAIVVFVGVPAVITLLAPVTWIKCEARSTGVSATASQCLFFIIPFSTQTVFPVIDVKEDVKQGRHQQTDAERRRGQKAAKAEDQGTLTISGPQTEVKVSCSPVSLPAAAGQIRAFLKEPAQSPLRLTVVANWKISVIVGGIATCFTLLYVVGATLAILFWLPRQVISFVRGVDDRSPESEGDRSKE